MILNPTHTFIETNGVNLHCAIQGEGPTIIFLHGFPEFWYCWKNQIPEFSKEFRVVVPDMRGYNTSDKPEGIEQYQLDTLIRDVLGLIKALGEKQIVLAGHDWGGIVAWAFAMAYPETLDGLVILNAPHPALFARELKYNPEQKRASEYILMFSSHRGEEIITRRNYEYLKGIVFEGCSDSAVFDQQDRAMYLEAWSQPGAITGGLNFYRANMDKGRVFTGTSEDLMEGVIPVPTLVIWGEKDAALTLGLLNGLEKHVQNLAIKRIPEATHWVQHDAPRLVNQYIWDFVAKPSSISTASQS